MIDKYATKSGALEALIEYFICYNQETFSIFIL